MKTEKTEVLHETRSVIRGHEPFLSFWNTSLIVNFHDSSGRSHNFIEGCHGIPMHKLQKGDILQFQLCRVQTREISWWENLKERVRRFFK